MMGLKLKNYDEFLKKGVLYNNLAKEHSFDEINFKEKDHLDHLNPSSLSNYGHMMLNVINSVLAGHLEQFKSLKNSKRHTSREHMVDYGLTKQKISDAIKLLLELKVDFVNCFNYYCRENDHNLALRV